MDFTNFSSVSEVRNAITHKYMPGKDLVINAVQNLLYYLQNEYLFKVCALYSESMQIDE